MPAISFSDIDANVVPAPAWRFFMTFPDISGSGVSGQKLAFLLSRVTGSQKAIDAEPVPFNASIRHFPTGASIDNLTLTFCEDVGFTVVRAFRAWIDMIVDDKGNFGLPAKYKKELQLESLGYDGKTLATFKWSDCMPLRLDGYEWDGSASNHIQPSLTVAVDNHEQVVFAS